MLFNLTFLLLFALLLLTPPFLIFRHNAQTPVPVREHAIIISTLLLLLFCELLIHLMLHSERASGRDAGAWVTTGSLLIPLLLYALPSIGYTGIWAGIWQIFHKRKAPELKCGIFHRSAVVVGMTGLVVLVGIVLYALAIK
jgi:hypothetical protein